LLLNKGNGQFRDLAEEAGVLAFAPTQTAVFADFNLDGWIDFFVGNESTKQAIFQNEFYLNNGNGTFRNVINEIGVNTIVMVKGCTSGDFNNDGWPDLYLSNYVGPNLLLIHKGVNAAGIPQFENMTESAGVEEPTYSFPTWTWDFNNDGWEDLFVSSYGDGTLETARDYVRNGLGQDLGGHPRIYRNNGNGTFTDISVRAGMRENIFTMGCNYGDLDADGYLDFYLGTGNPEYSSAVPNKMFRNNAGKYFDDITAAGGFGNIHKGHAVAFGDLDRDGDEDIFESLGGAYNGDYFEDILYENPIGQDRSWIVLQVVGVTSNRMAIGARVKVTVKSPKGRRSMYRTVSTGGSFGSSSLQLEIGLDNATAIQEIEIIWPVRAQTKQFFRDVQLNKYVRITEGSDVVEYPDVPPMVFR
ncbi:MAG TPA: VCBS repeat-containing protein, partial [Saprospiraceae bacterium]|nr:VCBS repeat-containing protein [Saprospiraceae bacterium]